jgi:hypothetical protein
MECRTISYDAEIEEGQSLTIQKLIELNTQLNEKVNKENEDYNTKELDNSSEELLTPYNNNNISEKYLEIQSLSTEEEVEALMFENSTRYYKNYNFNGVKSRETNKLYNRENNKLRKRNLIYEKVT